MCLAIPGKLVETFVENDVRMGKVSFDGLVKQACLEHVPDARVGDYVLVHVGYALSRIDETEARRIFALLDEMGELTEVREVSG
jgi:hydrogenase expression/formation protein HypC